MSFLQLSSDEFICDFPPEGYSRPDSEHISYEIESLFIECVHVPTRKLRERADQAEVKRPDVWKQKVRDSICPKLRTFRGLAEDARAQALRSEFTAETCPYRRALRAALTCVSDCERYIESFDSARVASELVLSLYPRDAVAHGKLGLLAWKSTDALSANNLQAMHHFCFELANNPPESFNEALKVSRFVAHVREEFCLAMPKSSRGKSAKFQFTSAFIDASWSLIVEEDLPIVAGKVAPSCAMWSQLRECLAADVDHANRVDDADLKHILTITMYSRHRASPLGNESLRQEPGRAQLADEFLAQLFLVICEQTEVDMKRVCKDVHNRKKNRTRFAQKKRKAAALSKTSVAMTSPRADASQLGHENLGLDYFNEAHRKVRHERLLSVASFLSHFWSKAITLSRDYRLHMYRDVMEAVARITRLVENFVNTAGLTCLLAQVITTVMDAKRDSEPLGGKLPALDEDVMYSTFDPCLRREMFRRVSVPVAPPDRVLLGPGALSVTDTIAKMAVSGRVSLPHQTAVNHSEAFAKRMFASAFPRRRGTSCELVPAMQALVEVGLRKQRLERIRNSILSYAGGRVARLENFSQCNEFVVSPETRNLAQRDSIAVPSARVDDQDGEKAPRQPSHKRRRVAAAKSQNPVQTMDPCAENVLLSVLKTPHSQQPSPRRAGQICNIRAKSPNGEPESSGALRNTGCETPRVFGQQVQHFSPETPVVAAPSVDEVQGLSINTCDAVDAVFFANPRGGDERYRWWPFVLDASAANGNPFFLDTLRNQRDRRKDVHAHWSSLFN